MLIYSGCELEHWRNKFEGDTECIQVFLHYNTKNENSEFDSIVHGLKNIEWKKLQNNRKNSTRR